MGTGVGEAMLIGAAVGATAGGAGAAIQGGDPLKGALIGGATGAIGGGIGGAFPAAGTTTFSATTPTVTGAAGASTGAATGAGTGAATGAFEPGIASLIGESYAVPGVVGGTPTVGAVTPSVLPQQAYMPGTAFSQMDLGGAAAALPGSGAVPQALPSVSTQTMTGPSSNIFGYMPGEKGFISNTGLATIGGTSALGAAMQAERNQFGVPASEDYVSSFDPSKFRRSDPTYAPGSVYVPEYKDYTKAAEGGIMSLANGGPVERMSQMNTAMNPQGGLYPQGMIDKTQYAVPTQRPVSSEMVMDAPAYERSNPMLMAEGGIAGILEAAKAQGLTLDAYQNIYGRGNSIIEMQKALKEGKMVNMAHGGVSSLGSYSDGGRMLKGPGDGMSDSIPGVIANKQPARLADGEFVVPADVVSHLGNGSTDAGAKQLYSMMDKVRKARTGKKKQAPAVKANQYMPA
jgi:hypothetical protein